MFGDSPKRVSFFSAFFAALIFLTFLAGAAVAQSNTASGEGALGSNTTGDDDNEARIRRGFEIARNAGLTLNLKGKSKALVGLGSYIVNAQAGCNDCHTHPSYASGGDPFLGERKQINTAQYLAGGREFGPFTSSNLTPDPTTGLPAGLTFEQFLEVMRKGTDFDLRHPQISPLLQVMPWPVYADMRRRDLRAIYEYLRAIPSLPNNPNPGP